MLPIPTKGISRSVNVHNVDLDVFCDWIEASVLFHNGDEVTKSDIVDALRDGEIYESQDFAWEIVADAWNELRRRENWLKHGYPFAVGPERLARTHEWQEEAAYSFCLALALAKWYPKWANKFGHDYTEQGQLFEELTKIAVEELFAGWTVHATGWTRTRTSKLTAVVHEVAGHLGEAIGKIERWTKPTANEAGLDLVCFRTFPDRRVGMPVYLLQCASGRDWEGKLNTPNLRIWGRIVDFAAAPKKAFVTPFAFLDAEFTRNCNLVNGPLLDRYRLLAPGRENPNWVQADLKTKLIAWLEPRLAELPDAVSA